MREPQLLTGNPWRGNLPGVSIMAQFAGSDASSSSSNRRLGRTCFSHQAMARSLFEAIILTARGARTTAIGGPVARWSGYLKGILKRPVPRVSTPRPIGQLSRQGRVGPPHHHPLGHEAPLFECVDPGS